MESKLSGVSSHRSLMLRKKMKAEIESLEKINAMEAELDAQKIAMEEKRLERAKALEKRRADLMAIILEEDDGEEFHMAEFRTPEAAPRDTNVKIEEWIEKTRTEQPETLKEDLSIVRHLAANNSRMERMMARQTEMLNMSSDPSLENLASWMQKMALTVSLLPNSSGSHNVIVENEHKKQNKKTVLTAVEKTDKSTCSRCKAASHAMKDCKKFQDDKVSIRWRIVKTGSLCFCCLEAGHRTLECPVKKPCEVTGCEKFHHKLLHKDVEIEKQTEKDAEKTSQHWSLISEECHEGSFIAHLTSKII
ncbi:unnamed protein product [Allacma fusca]|uniref:CCHC-type domain-containing protein n=1 Tax=Allacma fusca TaxID=39272 RepID=A0A8J2KJN1_9HEXA|nr:unnamed protein product [Allacma fusca]